MLDIDTRLQMWVRHCVLSFGANGKYPPAKWWSEFQHGHVAFLLTATTVLSLYLPLREEQKCIQGNSDSLKRQLKISMWPPKGLLIWSIFYSGIYPARGLQMRKEKGKICPLCRGDVRRDRLDIWIPTCSFLHGKTAHLGPVSLWNLPSSNSLVYMGHRVCICLNTLCKILDHLPILCKLAKSANRGCNCSIWTKKLPFFVDTYIKIDIFPDKSFFGLYTLRVSRVSRATSIEMNGNSDIQLFPGIKDQAFCVSSLFISLFLHKGRICLPFSGAHTAWQQSEKACDREDIKLKAFIQSNTKTPTQKQDVFGDVTRLFVHAWVYWCDTL